MIQIFSDSFYAFSYLLLSTTKVIKRSGIDIGYILPYLRLRPLKIIAS